MCKDTSYIIIGQILILSIHSWSVMVSGSHAVWYCQEVGTLHRSFILFSIKFTTVLLFLDVLSPACQHIISHCQVCISCLQLQSRLLPLVLQHAVEVQKLWAYKGICCSVLVLPVNRAVHYKSLQLLTTLNKTMFLYIIVLCGQQFTVCSQLAKALQFGFTRLTQLQWANAWQKTFYADKGN